MNLETEIELKRLKPQYIIQIIANRFVEVDKSYPTSFKEVFVYNKRHKLFFSQMDKNIKSMKKINLLAERITENANEFEQLVESGNDTKDNEKTIKLIEMELDKEIENITKSRFETEEFRQLVILREDFLNRVNIGKTALSNLILSDIYGIIPKTISFLGSFYFSYFFGDIIEIPFLIFGAFLSKFFPALLIYLTIDVLLDKLEEKLLWQHCKHMFKKLISLNDLEKDRNLFVEKFKI